MHHHDEGDGTGTCSCGKLLGEIPPAPEPGTAPKFDKIWSGVWVSINIANNPDNLIESEARAIMWDRLYRWSPECRREYAERQSR